MSVTEVCHRETWLEPQLERHRRELTGYCRRTLGSPSEAEDAVQETLVRAWRGIDGFEGRAPLRSWLYRIARNVCTDMQRRPQRRALPMDLGPWDDTRGAVGRSPATTAPDPADEAVARDAAQRAVATALRRLPPRQRAVLMLREVLHWPSADVAELLGTSVTSVNSLLQRARATLVTVRRGREHGRPTGAVDDAHRRLMGQYVDAFGRADVDSLVALLRHDASHSVN